MSSPEGHVLRESDRFPLPLRKVRLRAMVIGGPQKRYTCRYAHPALTAGVVWPRRTG